MKPIVGISACLAGEKVRYDGTDEHEIDLIRDLQENFELVPVCPEVAIGLSVPREPIHLDTDGRVMDSAWQNDYSKDLEEVANNLLQKHKNMCAFVFKSASPSCGIGSVKVKNAEFETLSEEGTGAFAKKLVEKNQIIFVEETSLIRAEDRQEFISRVLVATQNK